MNWVQMSRSLRSALLTLVMMCSAEIDKRIVQFVGNMTHLRIITDKIYQMQQEVSSEKQARITITQVIRYKQGTDAAQSDIYLRLPVAAHQR